MARHPDNHEPSPVANYGHGPVIVVPRGIEAPLEALFPTATTAA